MNIVTKTIDNGDGRTIEIETGKLAKQAHGSAMVRMGDTMLLATVVSSTEAREGIDFLPLSIEYKEKYASTGKFPGGFFKREARPSEQEVLVCRLVDRALRPLFPDDYHSEIQVMITLFSSDKINMSDSLAGLAASAALCVSDIPFAGPISEVRVARIDGKFVINPTYEQMENADMDMIVAGDSNNIMMVEGEMNECLETDMIEAIAAGHEAIKHHCAVQEELAAAVPSSQPKREYSHEPEPDDALLEEIKAATFQKFYDVAKEGIADKKLRGEKFSAIKNELIESWDEEKLEATSAHAGAYIKKTQKEAVRRAMLDERVRLDGRKNNEIRPIWSEVDYLPGTHGSSVFTRGETQSLTTCTFGTKLDQQKIDGAVEEGYSSFILHYNFPPFSTGEARMRFSTSRREIGHGNLALRALKPVIPPAPENPYTIRLVSEILESNGSSSMATVCAGSLALMDAGVKISAPVSGIAMGMVADDQGKYMILSDILGDEDHLGDMDFKVTGTEKGITACQMDIKVDGLSKEVLAEALEQAKEGRLHILGEMKKTMDSPREDYKPHAPRIVEITIPKDMIGAVIGPGGKIIQEMQELTNTTITIDEEDGVGKVQVAAANKADIDDAVNRINMIANPPTAEVGETYEGKVKSIMPYGAFVEVVPGTDGLLHISEIEHKRLEKVEDALKEGDVIEVKVVSKDERSGKLKLSRKVLLPKPEAN